MSNDQNKRFGYRAVFCDGSVREHRSNVPKTHCVRAVLATWRRYQYDHALKRNRWVEFKGGWQVFAFAHSEEEALQKIATLMTHTCENSVNAYRLIGTVNEHLLTQWQYSLIEAVEMEVEWEHPVTQCVLAPELCS
jgi:hypothetical protein